ncbi:hypothetical protein LCGC14_1489190 [marine sediment metagenome]|uniref:Uncharacterized protein n=1 Tax=marine sediment metagenome TaxID=412755 RepID=A0A0F9J7U7_9ZZZZ
MKNPNNTHTVGLFSWNIDTHRPDKFLNRMWYHWVRVRLRRSADKEGRDFLSAGFYINAPQVDSSEFFTGIHLALFTKSLYLGYWRPLSHYRLAEGD